MGYVHRTAELSAEARAERLAFENATIEALCRVIDAGMEPDGTLSADRQKRRNVQDCHLETAAMMAGMSAGTPRNIVAQLVALVGIWRDLNSASAEDRRRAGELLRLSVPFVRKSRGLA